MTKAVILICDRNFFTASLGAALSARRHLSDAGTRVIIFVVDAEPEWLEKASAAAGTERIEVLAADVPEIDAMRDLHRDRYLPPVTLARLWLHRLLPDDIDRFLYLDGDVLVQDQLDQLLANDLSDRKMLVAPDTVALCGDEWGRSAARERQYLEELGVSPEDYFNAGVILSGRDLWADIAREAIDYLLKHPDRCRSSDQSALNAVARGRTARLSQRWNYQTDHMIVFDPRETARPGIWHFTGGPKPWQGAGQTWPWDDSFTWAYRLAESRLKPYALDDSIPLPKQLEAGLTHRSRSRWRYKWVYPFRRITRGNKISRGLAAGIASHPSRSAA